MFTITEAHREKIPYFSDFVESEIELPDQPWIREVIAAAVTDDYSKVYDIDDLAVATTAGYLGLDTTALVKELVWRSDITNYFTLKNGKYHAYRNTEVARVYPKSYFPEELGVRNTEMVTARLERQTVRGVEQVAYVALAAIVGNLRLVTWLFEHGAEYDSDVMKWATLSNVECVALVHSYNKQGIDICTLVFAVKYSTPDIITWLYNHGYRHPNHILNIAAEGRNLAALQALMALPIDRPQTVFMYAVKSGRRENAKWLYDSGNAGRISPNIMEYAGLSGNLEMVKWFTTIGYTINIITLQNAVRSGNLKLVKWGYKELDHNRFAYGSNVLIELAVEYRHFRVFKWLFQQNHRSVAIYSLAIIGNHIQVVKWLHGKVTPAAGIMLMAIMYNRLHILKFLVDNGYPPEKMAIAHAAYHGHGEIVKWLHDRNYVRSGKEIENAIIGGQLTIVRWLVDNGYILPEDAIVTARVYGQSAILEYLQS